MAPLQSFLLQLSVNSKDISDEALRLLLKIAENVLNEPTNFKIRTLQKSNNTISKKILNIPGGVECLKAMGFEENESSFKLPPGACLNNLQAVKNELLKYREMLLNDSSGAKTENVFAGLAQSKEDEEDSSESLSSSSSDEDEEQSETKQIQSQGAIPKIRKSDSIKDTIAVNRIPKVPRDVPKVKLPQLNYMFSNKFLRQVELEFHMALMYNDIDLLKRAKGLIPEERLQLNAQKRLRTLQEQVKKGNIPDPDISLQDMLLLELLNWFKNDFFSWVDCPDCEICGAKSEFTHMSSDTSLMIHTDRVEMHKCTQCQHSTQFPRYDDPNILLITRRGRCGEWANCFTVMCRAMGWDARHVMDQTDHVWTEVYSVAQKRWLHCDPCENICDTPLVYENGWGKKLSYVIAASPEEVQDVTWRYSSHHKEIMSRRTQCTETDLINALIKLRETRQKNYTQARKDYLTRRLLNELVELMVEKKPSDNDNQGRNSGSLSWRLDRGEVQNTSSYCWTFSNEDVGSSKITVSYSAALDEYHFASGTKNFVIKGWHAGVFNASDVFRKEEKDWKMVYLARKEGAVNGSISWKFTCDSSEMVLDIISVHLDYKTYENGAVKIDIYDGDRSFSLPEGTIDKEVDAFSGCSSVTITAHLSGGKGNVGWQHAQLFRQSTSSDEHPFVITFKFKSKQ